MISESAGQMELFDLPYEAQRDCAAALARYEGQVRRMWDRLLEGRVSNAELARIALKYTARISDLRKLINPRGYDVVMIDQDHETGECWYVLTKLRTEV